MQLVEGLFLFALVWSVGCTGDGASRARFDVFLRALMAGETPEGCVARVCLWHLLHCWGPLPHPRCTFIVSIHAHQPT